MSLAAHTKRRFVNVVHRIGCYLAIGLSIREYLSAAKLKLEASVGATAVLFYLWPGYRLWEFLHAR